MRNNRKGCPAAKAFLAAASVLLLTALPACTPKMTTVRPAEISELRAERLADGVTVSLPASPEQADLKDILILQLEEPYESAGKCAEADSHLYRVRLYIGQRLDTEVLLCADGSVCRGSRRYVPAAAALEPVSIADWNALFGG